MGRIEISLEEYNSYKERIKSLEQEYVDKVKKIDDLEKTNKILNERIEELISSSFFDRLFNWNKIKKIYHG